MINLRDWNGCFDKLKLLSVLDWLEPDLTLNPCRFTGFLYVFELFPLVDTNGLAECNQSNQSHQSCCRITINTSADKCLTHRADKRWYKCLLLQEPSSCGCSGPVLTQPSLRQRPISSQQSSTPTSPWLPVWSLPTPCPAWLSKEESWTWSDDFYLPYSITPQRIIQTNSCVHVYICIYLYFYRCTFRMPPWQVVSQWEHVLTWTSGHLGQCWLDLWQASSLHWASSSWLWVKNQS